MVVRTKLHVLRTVLLISLILNVKSMLGSMEALVVLEDVKMWLLVRLIVSQTLKIQPVPRMSVNTAEEYRV